MPPTPPTAPTPPTPPPKPPGFAGRRTLWLALGGGLLAAGLGVGGFFLLSGGGDEPPGPPAPPTVSPTGAPEGEVLVSLTWAVGADLDLHVVDPNGLEIFVGTPTSPEGGEYGGDDTGGVCGEVSEINRETVTWAAGTAPPGEYSVFVRNAGPCPDEVSPFELEITIGGQIVGTSSDFVNAESGAESTPVTFTVGGSTGPAQSGEDDIEVQLSWAGGGDIDLHVFDANGFEVWPLDPSSPEGGQHKGDDTGGACGNSDVHFEEISWPSGTAPVGDYRAVVHLVDACEDVSSYPFELLIVVLGEQVHIGDDSIEESEGFEDVEVPFSR